ncbi:hypothetical protein QBC38DRAFT_454166 [Podospora fimiseda]|uniref:Uncharacterized protein n=1 Tax=Podospora fimiseda TaxID=252190 RepID=A0AAN7BT44_9PEZI|nr:hypothetical protein QBC38DRAFT_454166 [Podospora fimiseda]
MTEYSFNNYHEPYRTAPGRIFPHDLYINGSAHAYREFEYKPDSSPYDMARSEYWLAAGGENKVFNAGQALLHVCKQLNEEAKLFLSREVTIDTDDMKNGFKVPIHAAGMVRRLTVNFNCFCRSPRRLGGDIWSIREGIFSNFPASDDVFVWEFFWKRYMPTILEHYPNLWEMAFVFETCSRLKMEQWRLDLHSPHSWQDWHIEMKNRCFELEKTFSKLVLEQCRKALNSKECRLEVIDLVGTIPPSLARTHWIIDTFRAGEVEMKSK